MTAPALYPLGTRTSPLHVALKLVADTCDDLISDQAHDENAKADDKVLLALVAVRSMLSALGDNLSSPLFEALKKRVVLSGGDVDRRAGNTACVSLAAFRMMRGDGQHKAADFAVERCDGHLSSAAIRRALLGAKAGDFDSIRRLAVWPEIERGWNWGEKLAGYQREGEDILSYRARVEAKLIDAVDMTTKSIMTEAEIETLFR